MLTPQNLQEIAFEKALFGGYDMASVDDVLEPLIQDYNTLYKENTVLKSKIRLLVEKLEEYRNIDTSAKDQKAASELLALAEKNAREKIAEAERKAAEILARAETDANSRNRDTENAILSEKDRLNRAKAATKEFIETTEANIRKQLDMLGTLKLMDMEQEPLPKKAPAPVKPAPVKPVPAGQEPVRKAYDFDADKSIPEKETTDDIAREIELNLEKLVGDVSVKEQKVPAKFDNLQFGRNYNPTE